MPRIDLHTWRYQGLERSFLFVNGSQSTSTSHALVVSLHGFTENPEIALERVSKLGQTGFSLLAPMGFQNSWNADACCGEAMARQLDDVGFLNELIKDILRNWFTSTVRVYLTGFSNGAFMASKLALYSIAEGESYLSSVALFSGYSYNVSLYEAAVAGKGARFPVFFAHALEDKFVHPSGCCGAANTCCCGISSGEICFSIRDAYKDWLAINKCSGMRIGLDDHSYPFKADVICHRAKDCQLPVVSCDITGNDHFISFEDVIFQLFVEDFVLHTQHSEGEQFTSTQVPTILGDTSEQKGFGIVAVLFLIGGFVLGSIFLLARKWKEYRSRREPMRGSNMYELVPRGSRYSQWRSSLDPYDEFEDLEDEVTNENVSLESAHAGERRI